MSEINPAVYNEIADDYAAAMAKIEGIDQNFYDAAYEVLVLQQFDPELALLQPFYSAYQNSITQFDPSSPIITAVSTLQRHVLDKARQNDGTRYTDINDWLHDHHITVPQSFADLSSQSGFTIDDANIS